MKKLFMGMVVALSLSTVVPAQAADAPAIAIIDGNFDSSLVSNATEVCVVSSCLNATPKKSESYKNYNHGIIMADIVRSQNPNAKLFLLKAATTSTGVVTGDGFEAALDWLAKNAKSNNISVVSSSLAFGDGSKCLPTTSRNKKIAHASIVSKISTLTKSGVTIFSAAGNTTAGVSYPSCIPDLVVVSTPGYNEGSTLVDIKTTLVSFDGTNYVSKLIKSESRDLATQNAISLVGTNFVRVYNTTSVGTALSVGKVLTGTYTATLVK